MRGVRLVRAIPALLAVLALARWTEAAHHSPPGGFHVRKPPDGTSHQVQKWYQAVQEHLWFQTVQVHLSGQGAPPPASALRVQVDMHVHPAPYLRVASQQSSHGGGPVAPLIQGAGAAPEHGAASASLYVGDLAPSVTEPQLLEFFSSVGPVASIRVCPGHAYVDFLSAADAARALETLNYSEIAGQACRIMWNQKAEGGGGSPLGNSTGGGIFSAGGNIFVKNLETYIDTRTLRDTFAPFGAILSCKVTLDAQGVSRGFGFVQFETAEAAHEAVARVNGLLQPPSDKKLFVGPFIPQTERDAAREAEAKQRPAGNPFLSARNHVWTKAPTFVTFTNVYVKNIPEGVSDGSFQGAFSRFGTVTSATIMRDSSGASKGFGFVNFAAAHEARAAVAGIHGSRVFGGEKEVYCGRAEKEADRRGRLESRHTGAKNHNYKNPSYQRPAYH